MKRLAFALALAALWPGTASAALPGGEDLWATVNVCDTSRHPNDVGVRASMSGFPRGTARRVRFRLQWRDGDRWRYVGGADSGWRRVARSHGVPVEAGWTFEFPPPERAITFRGVVRYRWLDAGRVVRRATRVTENGHRSTKGADPADYSAATCSIA